MAAKGKAAAGDSGPPPPLWAIALRPPLRDVLLLATAAAVVMVGLQVAWRAWAEPTLRSSAHALSAEQLHVTPQPAWIEPSVKAEVIRDASLGELRLHDRRLLERLSQAFAGHSWVEQVVQVRKAYPARIEVDLVYRTPRALVEVNYRGRPELLLVDGRGVLLPSPSEAHAKQLPPLLRIAAGDVAPAGVYGTPWGDSKIESAAHIAALWGDRWQTPGLHRIAAEVDGNGVTTFYLELKSGARIVWGGAPDGGSSAEPAPEAKVAAVLAKHAQGPLGGEKGELILDLRGPSAPSLRTATKAGVAPR